MGEFITTYTGQHFEPTNPDPKLIRIEDIAHALSMICRGNGHVKTFLVGGTALYLLCQGGSSPWSVKSNGTCMLAS